MAAMPIYGKTLKIFLLQECFEAESWYIASETQDLEICSNNERSITFDLFTFYDKVKFYVPILLYGENVEKSFSQYVFKTNG